MADYLVQEDGTSKILLEDGSGILLDAPTLPTFVGVSSPGITSSTAGITVPLPAGCVEGDILILVCESADQTVATPSGWRQIPGSPASVSGQTRLTVFYTRHSGAASGSSVGVGDPGDHVVGSVIAIRGAHGTPNIVTADSTGTEVGVNQTLTITGGSTTVDDCLIVICAVHGNDDATASFNTWTNADLANITERVDGGSTQGNGGGLAIVTAEKASQGVFGSTTVINSQTSPSWAAFHIAFGPKVAPGNDNFANAEVIDPDMAPFLDGATWDCSTESGEPSTVGSLALGINRTQWWYYDAPFTRICNVSMTAHDADGVSQGVYGIWRGSAVNALTAYATRTDPTGATFAFGDQQGRGIYQNTGQADNPAFPALRIQVPADTPMYIQAGKGSSIGNRDSDYSINFEVFDPLVNDNWANAYGLDTSADGTIAFDLEPATGEDFMPATASRQSIGDIWYSVNVPVTTTVGFKIAKDNIADNALGINFTIWEGDDLSTLTVVGTDTFSPAQNISGSDAGDPDPGNNLTTFLPGQTYYIQVFAAADVFAPISGLGQWTASLSWTLYPQPVNDNFADAIDLGSADSGSDSNATHNGATTEPDEPSYGFSSYRSIWFKFSPTNGGWFQFNVTNVSSVSSPSNIAAWRGATLDDLELVDWAQFGDSGGGDHNVHLALRGGETYWLQLGYFTFGGELELDLGTLSWNLTNPTAGANDDYASATVITGASGTQASDIEGATNELGEFAAHANFSSFAFAGATLWYEWMAPADGTYAFWTDSLNTATTFAVWEGDPFSGGTKVAGNANGPLDLQQKIAFDATNGTTYFLQVDHYKDFAEGEYLGGAWAFTLHWATYVPTSGLWADALDVGTGYIDTFTSENFGVSTDPEVGAPDFLAIVQEQLGVSDGTGVGRVTWLKYTPPYSGTYTFDLDATGTSLFFLIFTGASLETLTPYHPNVSVQSAYYENSFGTTDIDLVSGNTYYIALVANEYLAFTTPPAAVASSTVVDIPQGEFTVSWTLNGPANDNINSVSNANSHTIGNLLWWPDFDYAGNTQGLGTLSESEGGSKQATNIAATAQVGEPSHGGGFAATRSLWFHFRPSTTGNYKFWVEGAGIDPVLDPVMSVYNFSSTIGGLGAALASDDDSGPGLYPEVTVALTGFTRYLVAVDARDTGELKLNWQRQPGVAAPANNDFASPETLVVGTPATGDTTGATAEPGEQPSAYLNGEGPFGSVWYQYTPPADGIVAFRIATTGLAGTDGTQLLDIYKGGNPDIEHLINLTEAETYFNSSFNDTNFVPINATGGTTYYIRISAESFNNPGGAPFTLDIVEQSGTPPGNDDVADATPATGGTNAGTTDGSTLETGDPAPFGGSMVPGGGTTWHTYIPSDDGFVDIQVSRPDAPRNEWYAFNVFAGATRNNSKYVSPWLLGTNLTPRVNFGAQQRFDVRAGETYWIEVIRTATQLWGDYTLTIDEYLDTTDWSYDPDGFTSISGSASEAGGVLTCSGGEGYGRFDANEGAYNRVWRIYFEMRNNSGRILVNNGGQGEDVRDPAEVHRELGIFRITDSTGAWVLHGYLDDTQDGTNNLTLMRSDQSAWTFPVSLGERAQDENGWVSVELEITGVVGGQWEAAQLGIWYLKTIWVDGKPHSLTSVEAFDFGALSNTALNLRYFDFGYWRYPSSTDTVEPTDTWETDFRNIKVSNHLRADNLNEAGDDFNITHFDGFPQGIAYERRPWESLFGGGSHRNDRDFVSQTVTGTYPNVVTTSSFTMPVENAPEGKPWYVFHSQHPGQQCSYFYGHQWGAKRWYGFHFVADAWPSTEVEISGYNSASAPLVGFTASKVYGTLLVKPNGQLWFAPWLAREFCVAQLELGKTYWIEVHCNATEMWDVQCEVFINGLSFGVYSPVYTYSQALAGNLSTGQYPGFYYTFTSLHYLTSPGSQAGFATHDFYVGNMVGARGDPGTDSVGPLYSVAGPAAVDSGTHRIPDDAGYEFVDLRGFRQALWEQAVWRIWAWNHENSSEFVGATHDETNGPDQLTNFHWRSPPHFGDPKEGASMIIDGGLPTLDVIFPAGAGDFYLDGDETRTYQLVNGAYTGDQTMVISDVGLTAGFLGVHFWNRIGRLTGDEAGASAWDVSANGLLYRQHWNTSFTWLLNSSGTGHSPLYTWDPVTAGDELRMQNFLMLQNPHVFPRFAKVADDTSQSIGGPFGTDLTGPSWDRIYLGDGDSHTYIGDDVSVDNSTSAVFPDNSCAMNRFNMNGSFIYPFGGDGEPVAHYAYNMPWLYLEYGSDDAAGDILAANLWARYRGCYGPPKAATGDYKYDNARLRIHAVLGDDTRHIGTYYWDPPNYTGTGVYLGDDYAVVDRYTLSRAPDGQSWANTPFADINIRLGFHSYTRKGYDQYGQNNFADFMVSNDQQYGSAVYALAWEYLVTTTADAPPSACLNLVPMNWRSSERRGPVRRVLIGDK